MLIAVFIIFVVLVAVSTLLIYKTSANATQERLKLTSALDAERAEHTVSLEAERKRAEDTLRLAKEDSDRLREENTTLKSEIARLQERTKMHQEEREMLQREEENRFKALAADILNANSQLLKKQHEEQLGQILRPLSDNLEQFKKSVTECYDKEARERFSLGKAIEELIRTNNTIGNEARELSRALKGDSKVQGDWGEMILEKILEKSGLRRDEEFFVQLTRDENGNTLRDDSGRSLRPDVVVKYPGGRCIVIDSKVSLTAYSEMINVDDPEERASALDRHLRSVRSHLKELSEKRYQDFIDLETTDFVMMFIPNEGAYIAAMQGAPGIWEEAYSMRVLLVSPTHLVSALRLISQLWTHDRQTRNAIAIADQASKLYDKFAGFVGDLEAINKALNNSREAYDSAMRKLSSGPGNLMRQVEKLHALGVKTKKQLPVAKEEEEEEE